MSLMNVLQQLLSSGGSALGEVGKRAGGKKDLLTGAVAGGALALLLGSKSGRKLGGGALKYGGVAALGAMAFQAYSRWQQQQAAAKSTTATQPALLPAQTIDRLPPAQAEPHARAMLASLIAAAKSDGHLDERERGIVDAELQRLGDDPATRQWLEAEFRKPIDPAGVAALVTTPEMAAEVYLASLIVVDDRTAMERAYLDELARQLKLDASLKADLEARAAAG